MPLLEHWNNGPGVRQQRGGLLHIEVAGQSVLEPILREGQGFRLGLEILIGNLQLPLVAADLNVVARHLAQQRHQHISPAEFGGGDFSLAGLDTTTRSSEHIDFPGGIESRR